MSLAPAIRARTVAASVTGPFVPQTIHAWIGITVSEVMTWTLASGAGPSQPAMSAVSIEPPDAMPPVTSISRPRRPVEGTSAEGFDTFQTMLESGNACGSIPIRKRAVCPRRMPQGFTTKPSTSFVFTGSNRMSATQTLRVRGSALVARFPAASRCGTRML